MTEQKIEHLAKWHCLMNPLSPVRVDFRYNKIYNKTNSKRYIRRRGNNYEISGIFPLSIIDPHLCFTGNISVLSGGYLFKPHHIFDRIFF